MSLNAIPDTCQCGFSPVRSYAKQVNGTDHLFVFQTVRENSRRGIFRYKE
ncbi:MAG: hypothetical protein JW762_13445 [Dehalococcoidales bacterium]|nr:hypothetical protein [Dehalococcoidales bacterium]